MELLEHLNKNCCGATANILLIRGGNFNTAKDTKSLAKHLYEQDFYKGFMILSKKKSLQ